MKLALAIAGAAFAALLPTASGAADLYSPALPASSEQSLECRIVNVTGSAQTVTVEAFDSTGANVTASTQTLAPGQAGGFAISGIYAGMYCKFAVKGSGAGFRTSIDVVELTPTNNFRVVVALPAH